MNPKSSHKNTNNAPKIKYSSHFNSLRHSSTNFNRYSDSLRQSKEKIKIKNLKILKYKNERKQVFYPGQKVNWSQTKIFEPVDCFMIGRPLGEGSFARVVEAYDKKTGKKVALKILKKNQFVSKTQRLMISNEIGILSVLSSRFICKFYRIEQDQEFVNFQNLTFQIYLVLERCSETTLSSYCKKQNGHYLLERKAKLIFYYVCRGVYELHRQNICHRDIKMTNILIDKEGKPKIIDLGFATKDTFEHKLYCGTPSYMAPEIIQRQAYSGKMVDIWALGVLLYKILVGSYPFGSML